jgi:hypothetical protein
VYFHKSLDKKKIFFIIAAKSLLIRRIEVSNGYRHIFLTHAMFTQQGGKTHTVETKIIMVYTKYIPVKVTDIETNKVRRFKNNLETAK